MSSLGFHLDRKRYLLLRPERFSQLCVERSQTITSVLVLVLLRFEIGYSSLIGLVFDTQLKIALNRTQDADHKVN